MWPSSVLKEHHLLYLRITQFEYELMLICIKIMYFLTQRDTRGRDSVGGVEAGERETWRQVSTSPQYESRVSVF